MPCSALAVALALGGTTGGCAQTALPPLPEAVVVVDTNLPVPLAVNRLRVDLYSEDGTWFASNDLSRDETREWPASFSVFADEGQSRAVWVRLRAYLDGYVESYQGERFTDWSAPLERGTGDGKPRLIVDGVDRTPFDEPSPLLAIDRLVLVRLKPNERGRARVLLHGNCVGTMTKLGPGGRPSLSESESCVDREKTRARISETLLEPTVERPTESAIGTWLTDTNEKCDSDPPNSSTVCVAAGATVLGSVEDSQFLPDFASQLDSRPVRIFGLGRYYIDRDEVTVARVRGAVRAGYTGARPSANNGPVGAFTTAKNTDCTYSDAPREREDWAVTCASWNAARALCQFFGGDLPTEAQWEHAGTVAGHARKRRFPWGNETPGCDRSVFARQVLGPDTGECASLTAGPRPMSESENDVSPLGIKRMFGNTREWMLDDPVDFRAARWLSAPLVDPVMEPTKNPPRHLSRGTSYLGIIERPTLRQTFLPTSTLGFRCAYRERP